MSFAPTSMALMPATLTITGNDIANIDIPLNGTGGMYTLNILNANAAAVGVGDRKEFDVSVSNLGNMEWTVGTPSIDAGDFTLVSAPSSVPAGGSAIFTFAFAPTAEGVRTGNVTFPGESFSIILSGEGVIASVGDNATADAAADGYVLGQNYPNPFISSSSIRFTMANSGRAKIVLSDVTGRVIATLAEGSYSQGENSVEFSIQDLPAGKYFYELEAGERKLYRSMIVRK